MIEIKIFVPLEYTQMDIISEAENLLHMEISENIEMRITKRSLDNSDFNNLRYKMFVGFEFDEETEIRLCRRKKIVTKLENISFSVQQKSFENRPVIVGSGPAGLFCALTLAMSGARPIVLERGYDVDKRLKAVNSFLAGGELDENCNIQYGEGGAGTFSDGKLKHGRLDKFKLFVLEEFIKAGADENITYSDTAHIGTDKLGEIVKSIRKKICSLGGEVIFSAKVTDIIYKNGYVTGVKYQFDGKAEEIYSDKVILATGHSARDIYRMLCSHNVFMEQKGFGVGVRVEHPQSLVNRVEYGGFYPETLGSASYHHVTHLDNGHSVYSFCMCPGGTVVPATSHKNYLVTNGMSNSGRDGENANSAILVSVTKNDFGSDNILAGVDFQEKLEQKAFNISGDYKAPVQRMEDFINGKATTHFGDVLPTYERGTIFAKADDYLPEFVTQSLRMAFADFNKYRAGFYLPDALMTGVETRSTSPVRVVRNNYFQAVGIEGLYPCGEGAGYAGGIVSSACDGVRIAYSIIENELN